MADMTIDSFIKELQRISPDKRKLPLVIECPNGLQVEPKIKMHFTNYIPPCIDKNSKLEKMVITWQ